MLWFLVYFVAVIFRRKATRKYPHNVRASTNICQAMFSTHYNTLYIAQYSSSSFGTYKPHAYTQIDYSIHIKFYDEGHGICHRMYMSYYYGLEYLPFVHPYIFGSLVEFSRPLRLLSFANSSSLYLIFIECKPIVLCACDR